VAAADRKMASASHSFVTCHSPKRNPTFSWTNAATSSGTKKIRSIVSEFGRFIAQTKYNAPTHPPTTISQLYTCISHMPLSRRQFFFGSLALPAFAKKPAPVKRNLLLMVADNLPSWALGASGNKEILTPNLDRLAQTGTRFMRHEVSCPAPASRTTLVTGRTPMQLGGAESVAAGEVTLDKLMAGAGYTCHASDASGAVPFLEQQTAGKLFFLTATCGNLRPPYDGVAKKYRDTYAAAKFETLGLERTAAANARGGQEMLTDIIGSMRLAAAAITALDDEVGAVLSKLAQRRLVDTTLVIFTSTCGALLGRHGLWDAGGASDPPNMFEEGVATPLIWSCPGPVPAQSVRPELVSNYDLLPSVCEFMDIAPPDRNLCGRSYHALATGKPLPKKHPWRTAVFAHYQNTEMSRIERYKLVSRDGGKGPGELYDLQADPGEHVNQYDNQQFLTVRTGLADRLAAWKQQYSA